MSSCPYKFSVNYTVSIYSLHSLSSFSGQIFKLHCFFSTFVKKNFHKNVYRKNCSFLAATTAAHLRLPSPNFGFSLNDHRYP